MELNWRYRFSFCVCWHDQAFEVADSSSARAQGSITCVFASPNFSNTINKIFTISLRY